ncbi:MAG TPA: DNA starvation/stationary phase protection protein Dps [Terriglobales bacterium]|nr:DNA starvation/stationary phase protection protein Dps [Terriglobales bacterium]
MTTATVHSFRTNIDIPEKQRHELIELLNRRLADAADLKSQIKYAHWNVKGMHFQQLHELFDEVAAHVEAHTDLIAERITALGGVAHGTARQAAENSSLPEYQLDAVDGEEHVSAVVTRLAKYANAVRNGIDAAGRLADQATADLFTEVVREADKDLWFLEAHLQK